MFISVVSYNLPAHCRMVLTRFAINVIYFTVDNFTETLVSNNQIILKNKINVIDEQKDEG